MSDLSFSTKEYRDCFENDAEALAHALRQANRLEQKVRELEKELDKERDAKYEAIGWMHADACVFADKGIDIRKVEFSSIYARCLLDMKLEGDFNE